MIVLSWSIDSECGACIHFLDVMQGSRFDLFRIYKISSCISGNSVVLRHDVISPLEVSLTSCRFHACGVVVRTWSRDPPAPDTGSYLLGIAFSFAWAILLCLVIIH